MLKAFYKSITSPSSFFNLIGKPIIDITQQAYKYDHKIFMLCQYESIPFRGTTTVEGLPEMYGI